jgi:SAM-dependent methyltransferase
MTKHLSVSALDEIARNTVGYYDGTADSFWEGTKDHDVQQNIMALLDAIGGAGPHRILDFGCGPGRDLLSFKALGHRPVGLDGSPRFCQMAFEYANVEVLNQNFLALDLPQAGFDGVFCNATLFHVPAQELGQVLDALKQTLRMGGVLFSSNPRGKGEEGWNGARYGHYHNLESWTAAMTAAGFSAIGHYYRPEGLPREQQPWLASLWRA